MTPALLFSSRSFGVPDRRLAAYDPFYLRLEVDSPGLVDSRAVPPNLVSQNKEIP